MNASLAEREKLCARYNSLAPDYSPNAKSCGYQIPFRMAKTLQKYNITPQNVLDCGSGTGLLGGAIRKLWPLSHITGIDFAEEMLAQSSLDGCANETIIYDLMKPLWPVGDGMFDLVGAASVINYAPDVHEFIASMAQATKPGGHVILSYLVGQENGEGVIDDGGTVYLWSRAEIEDCFAENGIELISSKETRVYSGRNLLRLDCILVGIKP